MFDTFETVTSAITEHIEGICPYGIYCGVYTIELWLEGVTLVDFFHEPD